MGQTACKGRRRKKPVEGTPDTESPSVSTIDDLAEVMHVSVLAVKIMLAAGMPGPSPYLEEPLETAVQAAEAMGVNERTLHNWLSRGMPGERGAYYLAQMLAWRKRQPDPEPWHITGDKLIESRPATGDALRALLRVMRFEICAAVASMVEEIHDACDGDEVKAEKLTLAIASALKPLALAEDEASSLIREIWRLV